MRISDWSSDVCSSDLVQVHVFKPRRTTMTIDTNLIPTSPRPIGYWLRVIDQRLDDRMRELFAAEGITRRDWRRLNLIGGAEIDGASCRERVGPYVALLRVDV